MKPFNVVILNACQYVGGPAQSDKAIYGTQTCVLCENCRIPVPSGPGFTGNFALLNVLSAFAVAPLGHGLVDECCANEATPHFEAFAAGSHGP